MSDIRSLTERVSLAEAAGGAAPKSRRFRARLIQGDVQGSSGYYPAAMLRECAGVFRAGLPCFIDHPTASESVDRPERSLRDLAGRLVSDARYEGDGLYADIEVYPHWAPIIDAMAEHIGMSIRASGAVEASSDERIRGPVVTAITEVQSVDFVTAAGAGGKLVALLESARELAERRVWREEDHPRDLLGRFASIGGGGGGKRSDGSGGGSGRPGGGGSSGGSGGRSSSGGSSGGLSGSTDTTASRGMPDVIASSEVRLRDGGSFTMARHHDGDTITLTRNGHSTKLARQDAQTLGAQLELADDWDPGDEETIPGGAHIRKASSGRYDVTLPDGAQLSLTTRDIDRYNRALNDLETASRVETGYGDLDIFADGRKIGFRHLGDDGQPVEVSFNWSSYRKISNAIDQIIDDMDDPDVPNPVTRKEVSTNVGRVSVELFGRWNGREPGDRLEIMPVDGGSWGIVVDGPRQREWMDAVSLVFAESRAGRPSGVPLAEAKISNRAWSDFSQADYTIEQWRRACLIGPDEPSDRKGDYKLPVREPDGTLNRNAVHAAAARIGQVDTDTATRRAAARKLIGLYRQLDEEPPQSLVDLAGETMAKESRLAEARTIGGWLEARLHCAFTQLADDMYGEGRLTRAERIALSNAIGDALAVFVEALEEDAPQLYERDIRETAALTANDLRDALAAAVRDTYGGKDIWTFVRDHTNEWVVFSLEDGTESNQSLFQQTYTITDGRVTLTGQPVDVVARTTYVPLTTRPASIPQAGQPTSRTETAPGTAPANVKEGRMPELTEEQVAQLKEAATLKTQLEEALTQLREAGEQIAQLRERADAADARARALENEQTARTMLTEALTASDIPAASHQGVADAVLRDLPLTESGALNTEAFGKRIEQAITAKRTEIARLLEEAGAGQIRGLGASRPELSEGDIDRQLREAFAGLPGMTSEAAEIAVNGRA